MTFCSLGRAEVAPLDGTEWRLGLGGFGVRLRRQFLLFCPRSIRTIAISLSGVCDLVLAYKNERLPVSVHDELWRLIDDLHMSLKAELAIDPSYPIGAHCLETLIQDRRSAVGVARSLTNREQ